MLAKAGDWVIRRNNPIDKDTPFTWQPESFGQVVQPSGLYIDKVCYPGVEIELYSPKMANHKPNPYLYRVWAIGEFDIMGDERLEIEKAKW